MNQRFFCHRRSRECFIAIVIFLLCPGCGNRTTSTRPDKVDKSVTASNDPGVDALIHTDLDFELPLVNSNPGYMGAQVCGECHKERLHEFQQTRHFTASYALDASQTFPRFADVRATFPNHLPGVEFRMESRDSNNFMSVLERTNGKETTSQIAFAYGHRGNADEVYFTWHGSELRELPLGWLHPSGEWAAQGFASPDHPTDFSRVTTTRCVECHTTWFEHRRGTDNEYRPDSFLMGVSCERCHGPGSEHVQYHRLNPRETSPVRIVNPGTLSRDQKMDICGQCHSNGIFRRTDLFSFLPGDDLDDHFRQHLNPNFEDDNVASQVKYLSQSKCFQQSETMSCITCHSPHHTQSAAEQGHVSCRGCHETSDCREQIHLPDELRNNCAECHMPKYARLAVRFHTNKDRYVFPVRSTQHRIGVYPEARDRALLEWFESHPTQNQQDGQPTPAQRRSGLAAYWLNKADEYQREHRFVAAIGAAREASQWDDTEQATTKLNALIDIQTSIEREFARFARLQEEQKFDEAIEAGKKILALKPNHAITLGKIGTCLAALGDADGANKYLRQSSAADPDNSYAHNMLGWLAFLAGDFDSAIDHFQQAEEIYPYTAENNYRWGLALIGANRFEEAKQKLLLAQAINPRDANVCLALCQADQALQHFDDALRHAYRAAFLTQFADLQSLEFLAAEYRRSNQLDRAIGVIQRALTTQAASDAEIKTRLTYQLQLLKQRRDSTAEDAR